MPCGGRWLRPRMAWRFWCKADATNRRRSSVSASCSRAYSTCHGGSSRPSARATARRNGRDCPGGHSARVGISRTGVRTPINRRVTGSIAGRGAKPPGMPRAFCRRMAPWPTTFAPDGLCGPRRSTAQSCGSDARVGRKSRGHSGPPKGRGGPGRGTRLPEKRLSLNNLTKPLSQLQAFVSKL